MDTEVFASKAGRYALIAAFSVAVAGLSIFAIGTLLSSKPNQLFNLWIYNGVGVIALALCVSRAAKLKVERAVWVSMAVAVGAWLLGSSISALSGELAGSGTGATVSDVFYLIFFPAGAVGLGFLLRSRMRPFQPSIVLDGLIVALASTAIGSLLIHELLLGNSQIPAEALRLSLPLSDLMLLTLTAWVLAMIGRGAGRAWNLIVAGLTLAGIESAIYVIQIVTGGYSPGGALQVFWPAAMLLIAAAAWQRVELPTKPKVESYNKLIMASIAGGVALALLAADHTWGLDSFTVAIAGATLLALIVRATVAFKENVQMVSDFRHEAQTDSLTGLGNRRKLMVDLESELKHASVASPRVLVIFDLDGFKRYNDTYGHPAGDRLLQRLGGNLARAIGPYGHGYRLGGDEFCVLVTSAGQSAKTVISLTAKALSEKGDGFSVTSSFGSVMLPHEARDASLALRIADQRMYAHKEDRRSSATRQTRDILMQILHEREPELGEHMMDVAKLARGVGSRMSLLAEELDEVVRAAELHDVGKMAIPDEILHKPAALDDEEWEFIRQHTIIGERILKAAPSLLPVAKIVRASHERWDGAGYPDRLHGDQIPLGARIVAVCDAYDAMTTSRPYRAALDTETALSELRSNAGSQFDPIVVDAICSEIRASSKRLDVGLAA